MSVPVRLVARRWWRRRFHPLTRIGWTTVTAGTSRPPAQTILGVALIGFGFALKRQKRRKVLYRGYIAPGAGTHIRVYRGDRAIHDSSLGG